MAYNSFKLIAYRSLIPNIDDRLMHQIIWSVNNWEKYTKNSTQKINLYSIDDDEIKYGFQSYNKSSYKNCWWKNAKKEIAKLQGKTYNKGWYIFDDKYEYDNINDKFVKKSNKAESILDININCIVGKNGCGKSSIINSILILINNYVYSYYYDKYQIIRNRSFIQFCENTFCEIAFEIDDTIHFLKCKGRNISIDDQIIDVSVNLNLLGKHKINRNVVEYESTKYANFIKDNTTSNHINIFTIAYNYSTYSIGNDKYNWVWDNNELFNNEAFQKRLNESIITEISKSASLVYVNSIEYNDYRCPIKIITPKFDNKVRHNYNEPIYGSISNELNTLQLCFYYSKSNTIEFPLRHINNDCEIVGVDISMAYNRISDNYQNMYLKNIKNDTTSIILQTCSAIFKQNILKIDIKSDNIPNYETLREALIFNIIEYYIDKFLNEKINKLQEASNPNKEEIEKLKNFSYLEIDKYEKELIKYINTNISENDILRNNEVKSILLFFKVMAINNVSKTLTSYMEDETTSYVPLYNLLDIIEDNGNYEVIYCGEKFKLNDNGEVIIEGNITIQKEELLFSTILDYELKIETNNKNTRSATDLSSGEKQLLNTRTRLLYDLLSIDKQIVNKIEDLNESKTSSSLDEIKYNYVNIFFDEVELYLHPEWQRKFLSNLIDGINLVKFNNIKGINITIATHSPFILSDVPKSNVLFLNEDGTPADKSKIGETFGANIHDLLKDGFFMESTIGEVARRQIQEIVELYYLNNKKNKTEEEEKQLKKQKTENKNRYDYIRTIIGDQYYKNTINFMLDEIYEVKKSKIDQILESLTEEEKKALKDKL